MDILGLLGQGIRQRGGLLGAFLPMSEAEREEQRRKQLQAQYLQEQMAQMQFTRQQAQAQAQAQLMAQQEAQRKAQEAAAQQARVMAAGGNPDWSHLGPLGSLLPNQKSDERAAVDMARAAGDPKMLAEVLDKFQNEYMAPVAGVGPNGQPVYMQPGKRGPGRVMEGVTPQNDEWERIPAPEGVPPGQQWYRNKRTGQERAEGQRPPAPAIGKQIIGGDGGPKYDSSSGQFIYPPSPANPTGQAVRPEGYRPKAEPAKEALAAQLPDILAEAEALLKNPKAAGGALASGMDTAAGHFGVATENSKITAQLEVLSAKIMFAQPRFEGPQGVLDVKLYEKAAGDIANASLPVGRRLAAVQIVRKMHQKYGTKQIGTPDTSAPASGGRVKFTDLPE